MMGKRYKIRSRVGAAIYLEEDLNKGLTNKSETYDNLRMNCDYSTDGSNVFRCLSLEVYAIV